MTNLNTMSQLPPTPAQLQAIAKLCRRLRIVEPLEERVSTEAEAGVLIRELGQDIRERKGGKR